LHFSSPSFFSRRNAMSRLLKFLSVAAIGMAATAPALAQVPTANPIPTTTVQFQGQSVQVPDWSNISFNTLPPILEGGSVSIPPGYIQQIGYNPSRSWQAGDRPSTFIFLGDVQDSFGLQSFSLNQIGQIIGQDLSAVPLSSFSLAGLQSPNSLVAAIPELANLALSQVPPLQELFGGAFGTVADAINQNPVLANTPLGQVLDLAGFSIQDIPGLDQVPLDQLAQWQQAAIAGIPGLGDVAFSKFPIPIPTGLSAIAIADVVFGQKELADPKAIAHLDYITGTMEPHSGATTIPIPPKPLTSTRYVELADLVGKGGTNQGKRWVAGEDQSVPGGYGFLTALNEGKEPTGLAVYPRTFKVALLDTAESQGSAEFGIYFRTCIHALFVDSCSPYFIGPIPWIPAREKDVVILGVQP
jgi:hypothetical protein